MFDRLQQMEDRYIELGDQLALPEIQNDREAYHKVSKAHRDLEESIEKFRTYKQVKVGLEDARLMLAETDPDIQAMAAPAPVATRPRCLSPRSSACISDLQNSIAGRLKSCRSRSPPSAG